MMGPQGAPLYDCLFRQAPNAILIKDSAFRYIYLNDRARAMFSMPWARDMIGKDDYELLPAVEADSLRAIDVQVLATGEEQFYEKEVCGPDVAPRTFVTHKRRVVLPDTAGGGPLIVSEIHDVTELRTAEKVLRESEDHYRSLIELHPQTPWLANAAGEVIEVGSNWEELSGRPVTEAHGDGWAFSIHPDDLWWVQQNWEEAVTTGKRLDVECRILTPTGDYRWYRSRAAPKLLPTGAVEKWYGLLEDIHERRLALEAFVEHEQDLRKHRNELEEIVGERTAELNEKNLELARLLEHEREVSALQRRFVVMISHEFRTPLAIIDAAAQRIVRAKDKVTADYLGEKAIQIKSAVSRMVGLMESILATGRMETGTLSVTKRPGSLVKLIRETASRRQEISPSHNIHVDLGRLPETMSFDKDAMERVFTNLLSNAVKYAPNATDISVKASVRQGCAMVTVSDNGIGIDAEDVPRIFDPYFRARSARGIAGTGIGLNIVREIVNLHGGSISVSSAIGMGTTFEIILPLDDACADLHGAKE